MKLAFIGAGNIAKFHFQAAKKCGAEVVAVCTRGDSAAKFAQENNIPSYFNSVTKMLSETRPDGVLVLTQPSSYAEILQSIKKYGTPVLLEKPIGYTYSEALALKNLLPQKTFVGQNRRFYPGVRQVRQKLQSSQGFFAQLFLPERLKDFAHRDQHTRDHWHMLNGIHGIDLLTYLVGSPTQILSSHSWGHIPDIKLPEFTTATYVTERKNRVQFMTHFNSTGGWRLHCFLSQQEIIFSPFEQTKIKRLTGLESLDTQTENHDCKPGFYNQLDCFLKGIQGQPSEEWVSFDSALNSMKVIEDIFKTANQTL